MLKKLFFFLIYMNAFCFDPTKSVVKIFAQASAYDYERPWAPATQYQTSGSGFLVEGRKIITCAHVVHGAAFIQVKKAGDFRRYVAKISRSIEDVDIAILTVDEEEFFNDATPVALGDTPSIGDQVRAYGFPFGGEEMSQTNGTVSRVEMRIVQNSLAEALQCDTDTAVSPGSSGGPVIKDDKVVGVAFEKIHSREGGFMISAEVLKRCIELDERGFTYQVPDLGIDAQRLENKAIREFLGLKGTNGGILVIGISELSPLYGVLKERDVILSIDDYEIAEDGSVEFRRKERTNFSYAYKRKSVGESINMRIWRDGRVMNKEVVLKTTVQGVRYGMEVEHNVQPKFLIRAGLVFQPLVGNLIDYYNQKSIEVLVNELRKKSYPEVVVLNRVLADELTIGYEFRKEIVEKVNGIKILSMQDLLKAFEKKTKEHVIELKRGHLIIIKSEDLEADTQRIADNYGIPKTRSRV